MSPAPQFCLARFVPVILGPGEAWCVAPVVRLAYRFQE